jgi:aspartate 1-decarboxylase
MVPFEKCQVVNVTNGQRWETYLITGEPNSGTIQCNGGGARLVCIGDILIIMTYTQVPDPVPADWSPRVVFVDARNRITEVCGLPPNGRPMPAHHAAALLEANAEAGAPAYN